MPFARVHLLPRRLVLPVFIALSSALTALPTAAALREVTALADPGTGGCTPLECTLREALAVAAPGDTITFAPALFARGPGTITLRAGDLVLSQDVTIRGPGQQRLTISGNNLSRVLQIPAGVVTISGVTITKGTPPTYSGGGIINYGTLTLRHSTVSNNSNRVGGGVGGGIANYGTLTLHHSTVRNNSSSGVGGGIFNGGTLTLRHSTVRSNTSDIEGGGISSYGTVILYRSTIMDNNAASNGGGIVGFFARLTLYHSTVRGNTARVGGGIRNYGTVTLLKSTITDNVAQFDGGGLYCEHLPYSFPTPFL